MKEKEKSLELAKLFKYDPETGSLTWRVSKGAVKVGNVVHLHKGNGYLTVKVDGIQYQAHRVIWHIVHGEFPLNDIDHINQDKTDNRLANLREVTRLENCRNKPLNKNNTSGVCGVSFCTRDRTWKAQITVSRVRKCLGYFKDMSDAIAARLDAEIEYSFHPNHGGKL